MHHTQWYFSIVFGGDSAGGGLSVATALNIRDSNLPMPAGLVLISPWVDLESSSQSFCRNKETDYISSGDFY
jgi:monoterpene epsilon-lactone hydrolase